MTYCSIEEAWGTHFGEGDADKYKHIVPDNADAQDVEYADIHFEQNPVYNETGSKQKKRERARSFQRSGKRLPDHNGPKTRYPEEIHSDIEFQVYRDGSSRPRRPSTPFHVEAESEDVYSEGEEEEVRRVTHKPKRKKARRPIKNISELEGPSDSEGDDSEVESDVDTGAKHAPIESFSRPRGSRRRTSYASNTTPSTGSANNTREHLYDISMYVITGIFIIFILDLFVKLGRSRQS